MLGLLVTCSLAADVVGIDMGGQYLKAAIASLSGDPKMAIDKRTGKPMTPAAVALKAARELSFPLNSGDFKDVQLRVGSDAIPVLKRHPNYGTEFLPKLLGKNESFEYANVDNATALMRLMLRSYIGQFEGLETFGIALPFYTTRRQMSSLVMMCDSEELPFSAVFDEITAMMELYAVERGTRFMKKPIHVMFVDVGGTSVKAYALKFTHRAQMNSAEESGMAWSEQTGGYFFAKAIAEKRGISVRKAQKLLVSSQDPELIKLYAGEIGRVKEVVREALKWSEKLSGKVDEIQVIGGASTLKAVSEAIKEVANGTIVKRDFHPLEAVAKGALLTTLVENDMSPYQPTVLQKRSFMNLNVTCGTTQVYCQKYAMCTQEVVEQSGGCDTIYVTADPADLPYGVDPVIGRFRLKNLTKAPDGNGTVIIRMNAPYGAVGSVKFCRNSTCSDIDFDDDFIDAEEFYHSNAFVDSYLHARADDAKRARLVNEIGTLIEHLRPLITEGNEESGVTDDMVTTFDRSLALLESGDLRTFTREELEPIVEALTTIKKTLAKT